MKAKAQSLSSVFSTIEKQTGYYVMYSSRTIQSAVPVSITATNMPLKEFLEKVLTPQSLNYTIDEKTILVTRADRQQRAAVSSSSVAIEQQREISGRVTNVKGDPVVGITVTVKGTHIAAMTNDRGYYTLEIPASARTIAFTGVGYAMQEVPIGTSDSINRLLQEAVSHLDELVIVGYGTQVRRNVVGSVSQIDGEELQKAPPMNLTNALAGRLPGLTALQRSGRPGADDATLQVRGRSSYASDQTPLVIIDGVERPSFAYLDPSEIESISILKDAVSTAVYGLQATNGIILITTKKGKANDTKINYEGSFQLGQNTRFPEFLDAVDYMLWYNKGTDMDNDYLLHQNQDPVPYVYGPGL